MDNSIYLGLSRQKTLQTNMTIVSNNIANMNTPGYRAQNMLFSEYMADPRGAEDELSFVYDRGQYKTTKAGPVQQTENPLDIALVGSGFFGVNGPDGQVAYSRAGNLQIGTDGSLQTSAGFPVRAAGGGSIVIPDDASEVKIDNQGALVTLNGDAVLDAGGAPIQLNAAGGSVDIAGDGVITQNGNVVGGVGLFSFNPGTNFERYGPSGFRANETTEVLVDQTKAGVLQGYIEQSNVNPVQEITRLITVQRGFEQSVALTEKADQSLQQLIQSFGR